MDQSSCISSFLLFLLDAWGLQNKLRTHWHIITSWSCYGELASKHLPINSFSSSGATFAFNWTIIQYYTNIHSSFALHHLKKLAFSFKFLIVYSNFHFIVSFVSFGSAVFSQPLGPRSSHWFGNGNGEQLETSSTNTKVNGCQYT